MTSRRAKKKGFLADYSVEDTYLLKPDRALGRPGIYAARNSEGGDVLIKFWPRAKGVDDADLEDIWRSELRQLQRLRALPRAEELFVPIRASGKDTEGFYLVLDPRQGSPLDRFLSAPRKPDLLARARLIRTRYILWANARRLAEGVELLHSQGAIHRNIDSWAVVTALSPEADFRLTGFEWSMRIASLGADTRKKVAAPRQGQPVSFARDWHDLALLIARLVDIPEARLANPKIIPSDVAEHASAAEIRLLRAMLGIDKVDRLDGLYITGRIDEIIQSLESEAAGREARLCLAVRLAIDSSLSQAIRLASGQQIEITQHDEQIRFVEEDLGSQVIFLSIKDGYQKRHVLVGKQLTYRVNPYRNPRSGDEPTWEFAFCDRADTEAPAPGAIIGRADVSRSSLELVPNNIATQSFPRRRGKVQPWNDLLAHTTPRDARKTDLDRTHQSLALLLVLEMAYAAADIFPVEVVKASDVPVGDSYSLHLAPRNDPDRAKLSDLLQLDSPAGRLSKMLDGDEVREEGGWTLAEPKMLGEQSQSATTWRFVGRKEINGRECLHFEGQAPILERADAFLTPAGMAGRIAQFKRRLKALTALRRHNELLSMLADTRARIYDSHDPLDETGDTFKQLDKSKQAALREILATID